MPDATTNHPPASPAPSTRAASPSSARVVVLNQYYSPDVASSGQLMHELAATLAADGADIEAVTTRPSYGPPSTWKPAPWSEVLDGVKVRRLWTTRFSKDSIPGRLVNIGTYMGAMFFRMLFSDSSAVYLYTTNPPFLGFIGAAVRLVRKHRYVVLLHDAHPQIGVWMGKLKQGGFIERVWERFNRAEYRGALQTIVLCERAKDLVCDTYGVARARARDPQLGRREQALPTSQGRDEVRRQARADRAVHGALQRQPGAVLRL
ncbi:MAG: glycosyltransferase [Phycisphaerales bacterium]